MGVTTELMNELPFERDAVITMDFEYIPELHKDFRPLDALWMDVTGVCGLSDIDVPLAEPVFSYTAPDIMMKSSGKIVAAGGHLHDGGTLCQLRQNNKTLCNFEALYGTTAGYVDPYGVNMSHGNMTSMKAGTAMTHISSMPLCYNPGRYKVNDTFGITAFYNATKHPLMIGEKSALEAVMGIAMIYVDNDSPSGPAQIEALDTATVGLTSSISVPSTTISKTITHLGPLPTVYSAPGGAVFTVVTIYTSTVTTTSTTTSVSVLSTVYVAPPSTTLTRLVTSTQTAVVTSTNIESVTATKTSTVIQSTTATQTSTVTSTNVQSVTSTQTAVVTSTNTQTSMVTSTDVRSVTSTKTAILTLTSITSTTATQTATVESTRILSTTKTNTDIITSTHVESRTTSATVTTTNTAYVITSTLLTMTTMSTSFTQYTTTSTLYAYFATPGASVSTLFTSAGYGTSAAGIAVNAAGSFIPLASLGPRATPTNRSSAPGWGGFGEILQSLGILPRPTNATIIANVVYGTAAEIKVLETGFDLGETSTTEEILASGVGVTTPLPLQVQQGNAPVLVPSRSTPLPRSLAGHKIPNFRHRNVVTKTERAVSTQRVVVTKVEEVIVTIGWAEKLVAVPVETMVVRKIAI
jgi:hypothetical protein